jgi:hypothetical protein
MLAEDKKQRLIDIVANNPDSYRLGFDEWMPKNWHIIVAFFHEANRVWGSGRRHHSARDLCAYLRHESAISEAQNKSQMNPKPFKISNNVSPYLARLYIAVFPERDCLFELKELTADSV